MASVKIVLSYTTFHATSLWLDVALEVEVAVEANLICKFVQTAPPIAPYPARKPPLP